MSKKMRLWMAGTVGVLMAGFMSVSVYALEEKDVIGTWYVNELSMGEGASFHPGAMGMEVTVDIKEDGKMETTSSVYGEEPEVDESEWKIENDKILMTHNDQTEECEYKDGKITLTADGTTMILSQEKEEYEPYVPGKPVENPTMKDFEGEWSCTLMEAFGMQMPVNADFTGFEMSMSVEDGKAEIILIESGEETKVELKTTVEISEPCFEFVTKRTPPINFCRNGLFFMALAHEFGNIKYEKYSWEGYQNRSYIKKGFMEQRVSVSQEL